ncbi:MAG: DUF1116 domain-containing protein [Solirubrobacterales bacterium]
MTEPKGSGNGEGALRALDDTRVLLRGVRPAREVTSEVGPRCFLHSGPPLELEEIPGPMRGAIEGALVFEGEAGDLNSAAEIVDAREIELLSCHHAGGVGAMAGIVTPSMPVVVGENDAGSPRTVFSPVNEGLGQALRFGSNDEATLTRLRWITDVAAPVLDAAVQAADEIDLTEVVAEGLRRGDECHNRNVATSAMLITRLAPAISRTASSPEVAAEVFEFAAGNRHFGLPFSMVTGKGIALAAGDIEGSSLVTAISGNGRRLGIRVSATGDEWFYGPAPLGDARYFEGYSAEDAQPTMGDSMISETVGFGGFALTAAPAITSFVGGTVAESRKLVEEMRSITVGESSRFLIPEEEFRGTPMGIDVHAVAEAGVTPVINNGLAHKDPGRGQVGAGITRLPLEPFVAASEALGG